METLSKLEDKCMNACLNCGTFDLNEDFRSNLEIASNGIFKDFPKFVAASRANSKDVTLAVKKNAKNAKRNKDNDENTDSKENNVPEDTNDKNIESEFRKFDLKVFNGQIGKTLKKCVTEDDIKKRVNSLELGDCLYVKIRNDVEYTLESENLDLNKYERTLFHLGDNINKLLILLSDYIEGKHFKILSRVGRRKKTFLFFKKQLCVMIEIIDKEKEKVEELINEAKSADAMKSMDFSDKSPVIQNIYDDFRRLNESLTGLHIKDTIRILNRITTNTNQVYGSEDPANEKDKEFFAKGKEFETLMGLLNAHKSVCQTATLDSITYPALPRQVYSIILTEIWQKFKENIGWNDGEIKQNIPLIDENYKSLKGVYQVKNLWINNKHQKLLIDTKVKVHVALEYLASQSLRVAKKNVYGIIIPNVETNDTISSVKIRIDRGQPIKFDPNIGEGRFLGYVGGMKEYTEAAFSLELFIKSDMAKEPMYKYIQNTEGIFFFKNKSDYEASLKHYDKQYEKVKLNGAPQKISLPENVKSKEDLQDYIKKQEEELKNGEEETPEVVRKRRDVKSLKVFLAKIKYVDNPEIPRVINPLEVGMPLDEDGFEIEEANSYEKHLPVDQMEVDDLAEEDERDPITIALDAIDTDHKDFIGNASPADLNALWWKEKCKITWKKGAPEAGVHDCLVASKDRFDELNEAAKKAKKPAKDISKLFILDGEEIIGLGDVQGQKDEACSWWRWGDSAYKVVYDFLIKCKKIIDRNGGTVSKEDNLEEEWLRRNQDRLKRIKALLDAESQAGDAAPQRIIYEREDGMLGVDWKALAERKSK